jgi:hypothetical protein
MTDYIVYYLHDVGNLFKATARSLILPLIKAKGKAIPLQALTGPEGSRRLRLPDFKTMGTGGW